MNILNTISNTISNISNIFTNYGMGMGNKTTHGIKHCMKTNVEDIHVVFIINETYVRWDIFTSIDTIQDMYNVLEKKYHIDNSIIEINNNYYPTYMHNKLAKLTTDSSITAKITAKNKNQYV